MKIFFIILSALALVKAATTDFEEITEEKLTTKAIQLLEPYTPQIRQWFWSLSGLGPDKRIWRHPEAKAEFLTCEVCTVGLPIIRDLVKAEISAELIVASITAACIVLDLAPRWDICEPTITSYSQSILYIVKNRPDILDSDFCGIINPGCFEVNSRYTDWKVRVSGTKPQRTPLPELGSDTKTTKILQFTDIHLDLDYKPGMNASCGLPVCCRDDLTVSNPNASDVSGIFGHVNCALPVTALDAVYHDASVNHQDTRYIFLTGDYVHSGVWLYSPKENSRHIHTVTSKLVEYFPNTPVYPLTGNHEPDVVNMYAPPAIWDDFDLLWMYMNVSQPFTKWLPSRQLDMFRKYGYYSLTPENDSSLVIIALNTNICYIQNFWLPYDAIDTNGQLQWLSDTLSTAEHMGQHVLIIGHIHPGSGSCWPVWSNQFNRIINRYEAIIRGQFYGHSHENYFALAFEDETNRPISVSYVGGSLLTDGMNSGYSVYYADGERGMESTWEILNQETYILKLNQSNDDGEARIEKLLDAKRDFKLATLRPQAFYDFVLEMTCDDDLLKTFEKMKLKGEDSPRLHPCDTIECKTELLADLLVTNSADSYSKYELVSDLFAHPERCLKEGGTSSGSSLFAKYAMLFANIVAYFILCGLEI